MHKMCSQQQMTDTFLVANITRHRNNKMNSAASLLQNSQFPGQVSQNLPVYHPRLSKSVPTLLKWLPTTLQEKNPPLDRPTSYPSLPCQRPVMLWLLSTQLFPVSTLIPFLPTSTPLPMKSKSYTELSLPRC